MIQLLSRVNIVDNSGILTGRVIKILTPKNKKIGKLGSLILISSKTQIKNKIGIFDSNKRTEYAKLGGQSLKGMICVTNGIHRTRIKPHLLDEYVSNGYRLGFTLFS